MTASRLEKALGYTFRDRAPADGADAPQLLLSPQRALEFLGDAILNAVIARACSSAFRRFPKAICRDCGPTWCARTACTSRLALSLGRLSALGEGEQKSGGQQRPSILADALEALFGASGWTPVSTPPAQVILRLYEVCSTQLAPGQGSRTPRRACRSTCRADAWPCRSTR
jgi:ribonuclease-3